MTHLYIDAQGREKTNHSFSGGDRFRFCPQLYKLERIDGWKEKVQKAAMLYGVAIENAVRYHHENGFSGGEARFITEWSRHRPDPKDEKHPNNFIVYNRDESSWE